MSSPESEYPDLDAELKAILQEKEDFARVSDYHRERGVELLQPFVKRSGWVDVEDYKRQLLEFVTVEYELSSKNDREDQDELFMFFLEAISLIDEDVKTGVTTSKQTESQKLYIAFSLIGNYGAEQSRPFRELLDEVAPHLRPVTDLTDAEYQVFEQFRERREQRNQMISKIQTSAVQQYCRAFGMSKEAEDVIYPLFMPDRLRLTAAIEADDDEAFARLMAYERNDEWEAEFSGEALEKFRSIRTSYLTRLFIVLMDPNLKDL